MESALNIITKKKISNPNYSKDAARLSKENKQEYPEKEEVEVIEKTQVIVRGKQDIIRTINDFITTTFEVE